MYCLLLQNEFPHTELRFDWRIVLVWWNFCHLDSLITLPEKFYHDLKMGYIDASRRQLQYPIHRPPTNPNPRTRPHAAGARRRTRRNCPLEHRRGRVLRARRGARLAYPVPAQAVRRVGACFTIIFYSSVCAEGERPREERPEAQRAEEYCISLLLVVCACSLTHRWFFSFRPPYGCSKETLYLNNVVDFIRAVTALYGWRHRPSSFGTAWRVAHCRTAARRQTLTDHPPRSLLLLWTAGLCKVAYWMVCRHVGCCHTRL